MPKRQKKTEVVEKTTTEEVTERNVVCPFCGHDLAIQRSDGSFEDPACGAQKPATLPGVQDRELPSA